MYIILYILYKYILNHIQTDIFPTRTVMIIYIFKSQYFTNISYYNNKNKIK